MKIKLDKDSYKDLIDPTHGQAFPFRPGMSATVDIKTQAKEHVLTVPIQSVSTREEKDLIDQDFAKSKKKETDAESDKKEVKEIVFVIDKNKAIATPVTTGIQDASYIEIIAGIKEGETVVKAPF